MSTLPVVVEDALEDTFTDNKAGSVGNSDLQHPSQSAPTKVTTHKRSRKQFNEDHGHETVSNWHDVKRPLPPKA